MDVSTLPTARIRSKQPASQTPSVQRWKCWVTEHSTHKTYKRKVLIKQNSVSAILTKQKLLIINLIYSSCFGQYILFMQDNRPSESLRRSLQRNGLWTSASIHLTLRERAVPVHIRGHRNVAEPLMEMFHDELMSQVEPGLVRPVPPGAVTPFISGIVTMLKDSVTLRQNQKLDRVVNNRVYLASAK